jgi:hypothetical protein
MLSDPHDAAQRLDVFQKDALLERYLAQLNLYLQGFGGKGDENGASFPLIYVVGLPRSGTTLLSQLISRYLRVGYINNLIARFWLNPVAGIRLSQAVFGTDIRERIDLVSRHGVTADPWGPHEFGYFWRYWLQLDGSPTHKLLPELLDRIDRALLRQVLDRMAGAFDAPIVFKNIICGLQAKFLSDLRPDTLFVLIERDPKAVAVSLLRSRKERYGDDSVWWSLKPSTYAEIRAITSPEDQIERQIFDGARDLHEELAKPGVNSIRLTYEALCSDPVKCLQIVANEMTSLGYPMSLLGSPSPLTPSR